MKHVWYLTFSSAAVGLFDMSPALTRSHSSQLHQGTGLPRRLLMLESVKQCHYATNPTECARLSRGRTKQMDLIRVVLPFGGAHGFEVAKASRVYRFKPKLQSLPRESGSEMLSAALIRHCRSYTSLVTHQSPRRCLTLPTRILLHVTNQQPALSQGRLGQGRGLSSARRQTAMASKATDTDLVLSAMAKVQEGKEVYPLIDVGINLADSSYDKVGGGLQCTFHLSSTI